MSTDYASSSHDGIPVFSLPESPLITGTLVFAVGRRDETARSAGCAHLVEHLVMSRIRARGSSVNAETGPDAVAFTARGDADLVVRFLADVARAVGSLASVSADEVRAQQKVIAAELGEGHSQPGLGALTDRFGVRGLGLLDLGSPAHVALGPHDVVAFARRWLHRANASIVLTGMGPDALDVSLPDPADGERMDRDPCVDSGASGWTGSATPGVTLSMILGDGPMDALLLAIAVIRNQLVSDLRHERHLIYDVDVLVSDWSPTSLFVAFHLDAPADAAAELARLAVEILRRIASTGADAEARREAEEDWRSASRDPESEADGLVTHAVAVLRGTSRAGKRRIDPTTVADATLAGVIGASMRTLMVSIDGNGLDDDDDKRSAELGLSVAMPTPPHYAGFTRSQLLRELNRSTVTVFRPRLLRGLRGHRLIVDDVRVTYVSPATGMYDIPFDEIALSRRDPATASWMIVSLRGNGIALDAADWRGGAALERTLEARLPAKTHYALTT